MARDTFRGRRGSDTDLSCTFPPGSWQARGDVVPVTLPTNTFEFTTPTVGGRHRGRAECVAGAEGNDRRVILFPELKGRDMEVRLLVHSYQDQIGIAIRGKRLPNGSYHGFIAWHNITFGATWNKLGGYWRSTGAPPTYPTLSLANSSVDITGAFYTPIAFTDGSRTSNVVTLTGLPADHGVEVGQPIKVTAADSSYDGDFHLVTAVGATTVDYDQTAADDPSAGAGELVVRTNDYPQWWKARVVDNVLDFAVWRADDSLPGSGEPNYGEAGRAAQWVDSSRLSNYDVGSPGIVVAHHSSGEASEFGHFEAHLLG